MNERELELVHNVSTIIDSDGSTSMYILHSKYTNLVRVNLVLLKALLEEKMRKGLMVTIDSPHQYISHLMQLHGVDQTNLVFLDTISTHASDTKAGAVAPEFQRGPFQIETLPGFLYGGGNGGSKPVVDMEKVEFVVLDNVSTLLTYNTMESIKRFFQNYLNVIGKTSPTGVQTLLVMDRDQHPDLFKFIAAFSRKGIDLSPDLSIKSVSVFEKAVPEPPQSLPQTSAGARFVSQGIPKNKEVM